MTRDQAKSRLIAASQWLDEAGSELPGADAAKRAMTSFLAPFMAGALNTPQGEDELVEMVVSEGRFHLDRSTSKRQAREFEEAVHSSIVATRKEPWPTASMSDISSVT